MSDRAQLIGLTKPFPTRFIADAPGGHGTYVAHDIVTQRLLRIVGPFDYHVTEIVRSPEGIIEGCLATLTVTIDGQQVSVTEVGDCDNPTQKKTQGDRLKNASSDAIKRCAMRLGLGLHLWSGTADYFLYTQLTAGVTPANGEEDPERPFA